MVYVSLNKLTNYNGKLLTPDSKVNVDDRTAKRWVDGGLASYHNPVKDRTLKVCKPTSIIILVTDGVHLERLVKSIKKHTNNYELIIISNSNYKPDLNNINTKIIVNNENKGFAYGCNQGIKVSSFEYICFINDDCIVTSNWLYYLQSALKKDVGFAGPTTCFSAGIQADQTIMDLRLSMTLDEINAYASKLTPGFIETDIYGFCMLTTKKVLDDIGVFDLRYGLGSSEEVDLLWRARIKGYKSIWAKQSYVHHFGHATFKKLGLDVNSFTHKNRRIFEDRIKETTDLFVENKAEIPNMTIVKTKPIKVSVIIPTYGREDLTKKCIEHLEKDKIVKEIIIVDDGFGSSNNFGHKLIRLKENKGFAAAVNAGINKAKYDVFIVNNDVFVEHNTISKMAEYFEYADIVGAKLLFPDGTIQHAGMTYSGNYCFYHNVNNPYKDEPTYSMVTGALMGIKREVFTEIGLFDENFFIAYEDVDFNLRALQAGFRVLYTPCSAVHMEGATRGRTIEEKKLLNSKSFEKEMQSRLYFMSKYSEQEIRDLC